jgi:hypothetical protein
MATASRAITADRRIVGWPVLTSDDEQLGTVKTVGDGYYEVAARHASDYWLPAESVAATDDACVRLVFAVNELSLWKNASGRPIRSTAPHPAD